MGLGIIYNGKFKADMQLEDMIEEIREFAEANDWGYKIFEPNFDIIHSTDNYDELFGIILRPPVCEAVQFTFSVDRLMCSYTYVKLFDSDPRMKDMKRMLFTNTQYAGIEVHKLIIDLFRYISNKYLDDFTLTDEGQYWETNDEDILTEQFKAYTQFTDMIELGLTAIPFLPGETMDTYIKRVVKKIHEN